jgi:hypothetical protein
MSEAQQDASGATHDVKALFKAWRGGDAAAGQHMAQRFSDWYYAITAVRLGDQAGRAPLERSCQAFAKGIMTVTRTSELIDWSYSLVVREVQAAGGRSAGGDFPNALTGGRAPSALIQAAAQALPAERRTLLDMCYDDKVAIDVLTAEAERQGGMPLALLQVRYELKRALRDKQGVALTVAPDSPDLDRAPLPMYESNRMGSADEEGYFEKWLITDLDLCQDVAEFATFTHALRAGALRPGHQLAAAAAASPTPTPAARAAATPAPARAAAVEATNKAGGGELPIKLIVAGGLVVFLLMLVAGAAVFVFFS